MNIVLGLPLGPEVEKPKGYVVDAAGKLGIGHRADYSHQSIGPSAVFLPSLHSDEKVSMIALSLIPRLSSATAKAIVNRFGSATRAVSMLRDYEFARQFISRKCWESLSTGSLQEEAYRIIKKDGSLGSEILVWSQFDYPSLLREATDSPLVLYIKGNKAALEKPSVAIVGTRDPSEDGAALARLFSSQLGAYGFNIVSGLAHGIDAHAHTGALLNKSVTTAVLGHGLDQVYPSNHKGLARTILDMGGILVSEFPAGTKPDAHHFPSRNRIIAGLSHGTLVVEAKEKGGALITARQAFDQNRLVFAIPGGLGNPLATGCNMLIRDLVAKLVLRPEDIIEDILPQYQSPRESTCASTRVLSPKKRNQHSEFDLLQEGQVLNEERRLPLKSHQHPLFDFMQNGQILLEDLALKVPESMDLPSILLELELEGKLERTSDGVRMVVG